MRHQKQFRAISQCVITVIILTVLPSCMFRLISEYDEATDKDVTQLQESVERFLTTLQRDAIPPGCRYSEQRAFYTNTVVAVSALMVRNEGRTKNKITVTQLGLLQDSLKTLESLHQMKEEKWKQAPTPDEREACLSSADIDLARRNLNQSFSAILKLELAKKRGE
jgi:hypothetical protein